MAWADGKKNYFLAMNQELLGLWKPIYIYIHIYIYIYVIYAVSNVDICYVYIHTKIWELFWINYFFDKTIWFYVYIMMVKSPADRQFDE